jgi:hypothetical protein
VGRSPRLCREHVDTEHRSAEHNNRCKWALACAHRFLSSVMHHAKVKSSITSHVIIFPRGRNQGSEKLIVQGHSPNKHQGLAGQRDVHCSRLQPPQVPALLREFPKFARTSPTEDQVTQVFCSLVDVCLPGRASASPAHPCARDRRGTLCAICLTLQKALRFTMCMKLIASWRGPRSLSASLALAGGYPPPPPSRSIKAACQGPS